MHAKNTNNDKNGHPEPSNAIPTPIVFQQLPDVEKFFKSYVQNSSTFLCYKHPSSQGWT